MKDLHTRDLNCFVTLPIFCAYFQTNLFVKISNNTIQSGVKGRLQHLRMKEEAKMNKFFMYQNVYTSIVFQVGRVIALTYQVPLSHRIALFHFKMF